MDSENSLYADVKRAWGVLCATVPEWTGGEDGSKIWARLGWGMFSMRRGTWAFHLGNREPQDARTWQIMWPHCFRQAALAPPWKMDRFNGEAHVKWKVREDLSWGWWWKEWNTECCLGGSIWEKGRESGKGWLWGIWLGSLDGFWCSKCESKSRSRYG